MALVASIKSRLIVTLGLIVMISITCLSLYTYRHQSELVLQRYADLAINQNRLFESILASHAEGLRRALSGISRLGTLRKALAEGDRTALLAAATPLFEELRARHSITHMYFISPAGRVLLRAHKPAQHGDLLERATFRRAAASRDTASGLEMGRNFFSLRCVTPMWRDGTLIGYLEVAEEIDHVFEQMKRITGNDVSLFLPKHYVDAYAAELAALESGDFTILYPSDRQTTLALKPQLDDFLHAGLNSARVVQARLGQRHYIVAASPFHDAFGQTAGLLLTQRDITAQQAAIWQGSLNSLAVFLVILLAGNALLYLSLKKSFNLFYALHRHIQNLGRSDQPETPLQVTTDDEIGALAADLNRMQARIAELQHSLERRAEQLATANQELEAFSYSLSHDLRLPLTRVYTAVQILRDEHFDRLDDTGRFLVEDICKASEGMEAQIEAMLTLAQISRREMVLEPVDLAELARDIAAELALVEPRRPVSLDTPATLPVSGDPTLLRMALKNLLENAWKYTRDVAAPRVTLGVRQQGGQAIYFVQDNGVGFDMQEADKLFVPFKRLPGAKTFPGTGIGLSIVKSIIQRHGGSVWASSAKGQGATFSFTLP